MSLKLCYSQMDRGWRYMDTLSALFVDGIDSFVNAAKAYVANNVPSSKGYIHCPCVDCKNEKAFRMRDVEQVRYHLLSRGLMKNYKVWNMHGEEGDNLPEEPSKDPCRRLQRMKLCSKPSMKQSVKPCKKPSMNQ